MNCIKCGASGQDYPFHVLQVQTLHVRDLTGEKRVQALGNFEDHCVCRKCAERKLSAILNNRKATAKSALPFLLAIVAGIAVAAIFWRSNGAFRLLGLGMLVCGILGTVGTVQAGEKKRNQFAPLPHDKALAAAAWESFLEAAPKKNDINDITYIPVNEETLARKNGELMILYYLLPEIAVQASARIHNPAQEGAQST